MGNDSVGFNKGVGLSRVAVWSAINDVFKLTHAITPGQAATIVDASPIIVGPDALARLSRMERLSELDHEVRTKSSSWVQGIVSYSQLWSVARAASVDLPRDFLLNSKVEAPHRMRQPGRWHLTLSGPQLSAGRHAGRGRVLRHPQGALSDRTTSRLKCWLRILPFGTARASGCGLAR